MTSGTQAHHHQIAAPIDKAESLIKRSDLIEMSRQGNVETFTDIGQVPLFEPAFFFLDVEENLDKRPAGAASYLSMIASISGPVAGVSVVTVVSGGFCN